MDSNMVWIVAGAVVLGMWAIWRKARIGIRSNWVDVIIDGDPDREKKPDKDVIE